MRLALPVLLFACTPEWGATHSLEALQGASGPPGALQLYMHPELQRDRPATVHVSGAGSQDTVVLVAAAATGGPDACPNEIAPTCLDVPQSYVVVGIERANNQGIALFDLDVPDSLAPDNLVFQAVSRRGPNLSLSDVTNATVIDPRPLLNPNFGIMTGDFAYDPNQDRARGWYAGATPTDVAVTIVLAENGWLGYADTNRGCVTTVWSPSALARASWVSNVPGALYGVDFPDTPVVTGDCHGRLDPAAYPDFDRVMREATWQLGITEDVEPAYGDLLIAQRGYTQAEVDSYFGMLFGGDIGANLDFNGFARDGITAAFELDNTWTLAIDPATASTIRLPSNALVQGNNLGRALYSTQLTVNTFFIEQMF